MLAVQMQRNIMHVFVHIRKPGLEKAVAYMECIDLAAHHGRDCLFNANN